MPRRSQNVMSECVLLCIFLLAISARAWAQKTVHCPDGDHVLIDVKQIAIQYNASSFAATLNGLSLLGARLEVAPKKLQEVANATQQWNQFLVGLAAGYNNCAVTGQKYADELNHIYPRLNADAGELEAIRRLISQGQKADAKRLEALLDSYRNDLYQFAQASGKEIILKQIEALSEQEATGQGQILQKEDLILAKLNALEERNAQVPMPTPADVKEEIGEVRKELLGKADDAVHAYDQGYRLLEQYRFQEAIPYLKQALDVVPLPDFYLALGRAYSGLPDLSHAESSLQQGLACVAGKNDYKHEARLDNLLGLTLQDKGDLVGALAYAQRALKIEESIYGADDGGVVPTVNNIGLILRAKGDLEGAIAYTERALKIAERVHGPDDPDVALIVNNLSQIFQEKGDFDNALALAQRALEIDQKAYGPDHPREALLAANLGLILQEKGDLDGALSYSQRALKIDEKVFGPDHPVVALVVNNIGMILKEQWDRDQEKGDLDGALSYSQRALKIDEMAYGPDHPTVATNANNIGLILQAKGDLNGALAYIHRAIKIDERVYGPDSPAVASSANNVGTILIAKGDLDGALAYTQRALRIDEKVYGPERSKLALDANKVAQILQEKGDLDGALAYTQRVLKIHEKVYGPDDPKVASDAMDIGEILQAKGDLDSALAYMQRALDIFGQRYGPDNLETQIAVFYVEYLKKTKGAKQH